MKGVFKMVLLSMLKTLSLMEWFFLGIILVTGIKGYIEYPNLLKEKEASFEKKSVFQR